MTTSRQLLGHVSSRVRQERESRGWTQQKLADRAKVSRRMLAGIEAEASNVSLATLDRIANAMNLTFADLVREAETAPAAGPVVVWQGEHRRSRALLLQSTPAKRTVELWHWTLAPQERYVASPDRKKTREMIYVISGALTIEFERKQQRVPAHESVVFASDRKFNYVNLENVVARFVRNTVE